MFFIFAFSVKLFFSSYRFATFYSPVEPAEQGCKTSRASALSVLWLTWFSLIVFIGLLRYILPVVQSSEYPCRMAPINRVQLFSPQINANAFFPPKQFLVETFYGIAALYLAPVRGREIQIYHNTMVSAIKPVQKLLPAPGFSFSNKIIPSHIKHAFSAGIHQIL